MERDLRIDNAKGIMIFFVVLGHVLEQITLSWSSPQIALILYFIWSVHMPAFIMLAGLTYKKENYIRNAGNILVLYLAFNFLYQAKNIYINGFSLDMIIYPAWGMWFLMTLFFMIIISRFLLLFRHAVIFSVVVSVMSGFLTIDGYILSISRTFVFLPFFIIGVRYKNRILSGIKRKYICMFAYSLACCLLFLTSLDKKWLYGSFEFWQMPSDFLSSYEYPAIRLALTIVSLVGCLAFLSFSSKNRTILTKIGANSLSIYIFHFFIISRIRPYIEEYASWSNVYSQVALSMFISVFICVFLSPSFINKIIRNLMIFRKKK